MSHGVNRGVLKGNKKDERDPFIEKLIQNLNRKETKIEDIEIKDKKDIEIEEIDNQVEENKDIKKLTITASTKPDNKKKGGGFIIE